jgi:hypothetical protein
MSAVRKPKIAPVTEPVENVVVLPTGRVELCAARGDIRYYLNHPFLDLSDKKKPMLVATNGHVMAVAHVAIEGDVTEGPVPVAAIKAARAVKTKQPQIGARLLFVGDMCGTKDVMFRRPQYDFKFPDWRKVIPQVAKDAKPDIGINGDYMHTLQLALSGKSARYPGLKFYCTHENGSLSANKAVRVMSVDAACQDVIGVVMPLSI